MLWLADAELVPELPRRHMGLFFWGIVVTMVLLFGCLACMMWDAGSDAHKLNKKRKAKSALAKKGW